MSDNPTPPIMSLVQRGSDKFPRFVISKADQIGNPLYWESESEKWLANEGKATVFANLNDVMWEHHRLMMEGLEGTPCHRFTMPLQLELYGQKPDLAELQDWLERAVRILVRAPDCGYGPDGSVGVVFADYSKLREKKR